uniref:Conotoxin Cltx-2 n=1 Tax=Californiconus californicus TaxID=1736779 RepID=CUX2_CONCL|nr:RecName: Full=Conotoxin Cltx-2; AltName: Full=CalTx-2 [Californiconus californicus]
SLCDKPHHNCIDGQTCYHTCCQNGLKCVRYP